MFLKSLNFIQCLNPGGWHEPETGGAAEAERQYISSLPEDIRLVQLPVPLHWQLPEPLHSAETSN